MLIVYGIHNCDTVKRTRHALDAAGVAYRYHDLRKDGISAADVEHWLRALGVDSLINRQGSTWRKLDDAVRERLYQGHIDTVLEHPSVIKRPVLVHNGECRVGFARDDEAEILRWASS